LTQDGIKWHDNTLRRKIRHIGGYDTDDNEVGPVQLFQMVSSTDNLDEMVGLVVAAPVFARISDAAIRPVALDDSTHSLQTISYEHHEIHGGSHYFVIMHDDLSINNVLQFTWQMPDTTKWIHWIWKISTESETLWQIYEGGTINNPLANAVTPYNSNRNSINLSGTTMRSELHNSLAAADTDVDISGTTLLASGISGSGRNEGFEFRSNEWVMKQNQLYVLRATANAAGFINFDMQWYEHTDKD